MKPMYSFRQVTLVLIIFFKFSVSAFAQQVLPGKVQDGESNALPFASVLLLHEQDSSIVSSTISDGEGHFQFSEVGSGHFLIRVLMSGYRSIHTPVTVDGNPAPRLTITLREDTEKSAERRLASYRRGVRPIFSDLDSTPSVSDKVTFLQESSSYIAELH